MIVNTLKLIDNGYPERLKQLAAPPVELFYRGAEPSDWLKRPVVTIVGSRKASAYGRDVTRRLAGQLASRGAVIASGLAYGIDAEAHGGALEAGGLTVAVLPTSLERIYPRRHLPLADRIVNGGGCLMSEYGPSTPSQRSHFVMRNRILAALADVLVITEAAINSGTMHTARYALEQGKTVMAVPGNIDQWGSQGCNNLIKAGALTLTGSDDVLLALGYKKTGPAEAKPRFSGSPAEAALYKLLRGGAAHQDDLMGQSQLAAADFNAALTSLEINGYIRPLGGGHWAAS